MLQVDEVEEGEQPVRWLLPRVRETCSKASCVFPGEWEGGSLRA